MTQASLLDDGAAGGAGLSYRVEMHNGKAKEGVFSFTPALMEEARLTPGSRIRVSCDATGGTIRRVARGGYKIRQRSKRARATVNVSARQFGGHVPQLHDLRITGIEDGCIMFAAGPTRPARDLSPVMSLLAEEDLASASRRARVFRIFGLQRRAQHATTEWFQIVRDITPKMAADLLDIHEDAVATLGKLHPIQRRRIEHAIERYARDMKKGRWGEGGSPFMWSIHGLCQNGQQRLYSCVRSGVTLRAMPIELDHDPDAILNIDQEVGRTQLCGLQCTGRQPGAKAHHVAVAKMMEGIGGKQPTGSCKHTLLELDERMTLHWPAIHFAIGSTQGHKMAGLTVAAIVAAVAKAYYHEADKQKLTRFMPLLIGFVEPQDSVDRTVVNYAGHLLRAPRSNSGQARQLLHLKTQHVVFCYMRGEARRSFRIMRTEAYPLPSDNELRAGQEPPP